MEPWKPLPITKDTVDPFEIYDSTCNAERAARIWRHTQPLLEKIGGWMTIVMACACLFGIIALVDMIGKKGGGG